MSSQRARWAGTLAVILAAAGPAQSPANVSRPHQRGLLKAGSGERAKRFFRNHRVQGSLAGSPVGTVQLWPAIDFTDYSYVPS
jgi:hypothetical protein